MRAIFLFLALTIASATSAAEVKGLPRIVDADTVAISGTTFRLIGIDAPEMDQVCLDGGSHTQSCGIEARNRLEEHFRNREWTCQIQGTDRYRRGLAVCTVEGKDVGKWLVANGWALAFRRYSGTYIADEETARIEKKWPLGGSVHCALGLAAPKLKHRDIGCYQRPHRRSAEINSARRPNARLGLFHQG